uniref:FUN14 domain containing 1 n=1 Tax=Bos indicus x Bos taurus TaxID=30522 RepID=A0A4W2D4R9_BOBOX
MTEIFNNLIIGPRTPLPKNRRVVVTFLTLDLTEYVRRHHWWSLVFGHSSGPVVESYSVATQIVMDEVSDRCVGFLFQKVGKLAATGVGGGFLLLQIATTELVKQNLVISGGFVGGFLLGLESSGYECSVMVGYL